MRDRLRWGILSTAKVAQANFIAALQQSSNGEVIAIASRDSAKARECAERFGIPKALESYEALIQDREIDAVYVPLPLALHAPWSMRGADAGKHVLCEKPLATSAPEARMLKKHFAERGVLLGEAIMYHFHPLTQGVLALVNSGAIGTVRTIQTTIHVNVGDGDIRFQKALGGGSLQDVGCYCVSALRLLAGGEPDRVTGFKNIGTESGVDESFAGSLHFPSGILASFHCSLRTSFDCRYDIVGSKGRIYVDRGAMCAWPGETFTIQVWSDVESPGYREITIPPADPYRLLVDDFTDAVLTGRAPAVSIDESIRNQEVLDQLQQSASEFAATGASSSTAS